MSTTPLPEVAVKYSGKQEEAGSIFAIDFDMASRGAEIDWLSQFPHERELLFPPCTMLECTGYYMRGAKRLVMVRATVSNAIPDISGIEEPDDVPPSGGASASGAVGANTNAVGGASVPDASGGAATSSSPASSSSPAMPTVVSVHMVSKKSTSKLSQMMSLFKSMGGGSSSSKAVEAHDDDPLRAGLRELLKPLKLDGEVNPFGSLRETHGKVDLAMAWCEEEGLTTISDLFESDEEGQNSFVAALKLKKFKEKQLLKNLKAASDGDAKPPSASGHVPLNTHI